jgi:hypothetical protein
VVFLVGDKIIPAILAAIKTWVLKYGSIGVAIKAFIAIVDVLNLIAFY